MKRIILLLLIVLIIIGCNPDGGEIEVVRYREGKQALVMEFYKDAPPKEVYEKNPFPVFLSILNKGSSTTDYYLTLAVERDYICISDSEGNCVDGDFNPTGTFTIQKNAIDPFVEESREEFYLASKEIPELISNIPTTVAATLCYPYTTLFSQDICVDPDPFSLKEGVMKVCDIGDISLSRGQGAPVAVTKIEPRMLPSEQGMSMQLILTIENVGNGVVIHNKGDYIKNYCTKEGIPVADYELGRSTLLNRVIVSVRLPSVWSQEFDCGSKDNPGILRLNDMSNIIICKSPSTLPDDIIQAFISPLEIELDYGYSITKSKVVTVKKLSSLSS